MRSPHKITLQSIPLRFVQWLFVGFHSMSYLTHSYTNCVHCISRLCHSDSIHSAIESLHISYRCFSVFCIVDYVHASHHSQTSQSWHFDLKCESGAYGIVYRLPYLRETLTVIRMEKWNRNANCTAAASEQVYVRIVVIVRPGLSVLAFL